VEGDQLIKEGIGFGAVGFGDPAWTDYVLTFEARKSAGPDGFGVCFRASEGRWYYLWIGGNRNGKHCVGKGSAKKPIVAEIRSQPGAVKPLDWYRVSISARGPFVRIHLDDHLLFAFKDSYSLKGSINLHYLNSAGRFRNIKVAAHDGTVLWEGPPNLPKKR
jgi:hypothetical protein